MRLTLALLAVAACNSEQQLLAVPSTPDFTLTMGDGSLDPSALGPLQSEMAEISVHGTRPPAWDHGRWQFSLDLIVDTPGGHLGEQGVAVGTTWVDPEDPDSPEIDVAIQGVDWPLDAGGALEGALEATGFGWRLAPPADSDPALLDAERRPTDVLFVLDSSISMRTVVARIQRVFAEMALVDAFPPDTRIAVMSTIPGDPSGLGALHPAVRDRRLARLDPGFLRLVDQGSITRWREQADVLTWVHQGCDAWFGPRDRDPNRVPCLVAHTQLSAEVVGAEAGLTAFSQLLERTSGHLFRDGADVNVVFVSDTHDPGVSPEGKRADEILALTALRPTGSELAAQVAAHEDVASFQIHAIAPLEGCRTSERWESIGPKYAEAAAETGGRALDLCSDTGTATFLFAALSR
jgi:hypothetical protein